MPLNDLRQYRMKVASAEWTTSSTGTSGLAILFECEDGSIYDSIWLSEKAKNMARGKFHALGVRDEELLDPAYVEFRLLTDLVGREVDVKLKVEVYKGERKLKVEKITNPNAPKKEKIGAEVSSFFGGASKPARQSIEDEPLTNEDIPF